jgi:hypothetical protein
MTHTAEVSTLVHLTPEELWTLRMALSTRVKFLEADLIPILSNPGLWIEEVEEAKALEKKLRACQ